jgi:hypothetical protein
MNTMHQRASWVVAAALAGAACVGNIGDGRSTGSGGAAGGSAAKPSSGSSSAPAPVPGPASVLNFPNGAAPVARLRRLTTPEFTFSLQDLLGGSDVPVSAVDPDVSVGVFGPSAVNLGGFAAIGASSIAVSPSGVGLYEAAVRGAVSSAFGHPAQLSSILPCVPTATTDTACLTQAIHAFGRRAFRRPLSGDETTTFVNLATHIGNQPGSSVLTGLQYAISAILQWPDFVYRVELGVASPADGGRLKYTSYEIASRLAATLWSSVPDDTLLDAAAMDALSTTDGITAQAQRMLADSRVHRALAAFTDELLALQSMSTITKDKTLFPSWTDTLGPAMQQEVELRVDDIVFTQKADFFSLFQSPSTFVNGELAQFYGLPQPSGSGFQPATFPAGSPRLGILGSGAILATEALSDRTSPVKRGLLVDQMLRCMVIPAPPPGVPPLPPTQSSSETVRQELDAHVASPQCNGCHNLLDPIGFGMENFDAIGQYRTMEKGQPIDASGNLNGIAFHDLAGLETAVQKDPAAAPCLVSNFYVRAMGRAAIGYDEPSINTLTTQFAAAGNRVDQLLVSLVSSDSFRFVVPQ